MELPELPADKKTPPKMPADRKTPPKLPADKKTPPKKELQHPSALKVSQESHKIKKPPPSPSANTVHRQASPTGTTQQRREPVVIYEPTQAITVRTESDFRDLVQRLTGLPSGKEPAAGTGFVPSPSRHAFNVPIQSGRPWAPSTLLPTVPAFFTSMTEPNRFLPRATPPSIAPRSFSPMTEPASVSNDFWASPGFSAIPSGLRPLISPSAPVTLTPIVPESSSSVTESKSLKDFLLSVDEFLQSPSDLPPHILLSPENTTLPQPIAPGPVTVPLTPTRPILPSTENRFLARPPGWLPRMLPPGPRMLPPARATLPPPTAPGPIPPIAPGTVPPERKVMSYDEVCLQMISIAKSRGWVPGTLPSGSDAVSQFIRYMYSLGARQFGLPPVIVSPATVSPPQPRPSDLNPPQPSSPDNDFFLSVDEFLQSLSVSPSDILSPAPITTTQPSPSGLVSDSTVPQQRSSDQFNPFQ